MPEPEIEMILVRQLASCLAMPILVVDDDGALLYFNEPAEAIIGQRFEETGEIGRLDWARLFKPTDRDGKSIEDRHPLFITTQDHRPFYRRFWIQGLDGVAREIEATTFPLTKKDGTALGAVGIFWEAERS